MLEISLLKYTPNRETAFKVDLFLKSKLLRKTMVLWDSDP